MMEVTDRKSSKEITWFFCLIGYSKRLRTGTTSLTTYKKSLENRTIVLASWVPLRILKLMNAGEDDQIVAAATKAISSPTLNDTGFKHYKGLPKRFEFVCVLGEIAGEENARRIMEKWEKASRGRQPRTIYAHSLAHEFSLRFSINFDALLRISQANRCVRVVRSTLNGPTLLFVYKPKCSPMVDTICSRHVLTKRSSPQEDDRSQ